MTTNVENRVKIYEVKVENNLALQVAAPTETAANEIAQILLDNGLFPNHRKSKVSDLLDVTEQVTDEEFQIAVHRSIEAIAWNPAAESRNCMPLLAPVIKHMSLFLKQKQLPILTLSGTQPLVLIAEETHAKLLAANVPTNAQWIRWTYGVNAAKEPVRNYMSIESYIHALQQTVLAHDSLYEQNQSIITDSMYDALYATLVSLELQYPYMVHNQSPTQRIVSVIVDSLEKVRHSRPMLSLDKTTTDEGLLKFIEQRPGEPILVQRKEDGLTIVGTFDTGVQQDFVSRGDSDTGERLFHSCSQIQNIPQKIAFDKRLELRFEVIVPYADFERINKDGKYSNTRNLASGTVRSLDGALTRERGLKAYVIEIVEIEGMEFEFDHERIEFVRSLGFEISDTYEFFFGPLKDVKEETARFLKFVNDYNTQIRPTLPHMIDGRATRLGMKSA